MAIAGRHVRHDWKTWVDDDRQKSVRTMCGRTSRRELAGVPGVTPQEVLVTVGDRKISGWCPQCAYEMTLYALASLNQDLHPYILPMYEGAIAEANTGYIYWHAMLARRVS